MIDSGNFVRAIIESPGLAGRMLTAISNVGDCAISFSHFEQVAMFRLHDRAAIMRLLDSLCSVGVLVYEGNGWRTILPLGELQRLALLAEGAEAAVDCHEDRDTVQLVVTFPWQGCFMEALRETGPYYASIALTAEAFVKAAAQAQSRLVIMTPFLDRDGLEIVKKMFAEVGPSVEKIFLLRDIPKLMTLDIAADLARMNTFGVKLLDYMVGTPGGPARYETFHSKIILCDYSMAYIGSANLLESSLSLAFEVGVMIKGKTVGALGRLIDSILEALATKKAGSIQ